MVEILILCFVNSGNRLIISVVLLFLLQLVIPNMFISVFC